MVGRNSSDARGSFLRMSNTEQTHVLDYADGEDFDMDLKHVRDKNEATTSLSTHKRGGTPWFKHDNIWTAKQAEFVNKELSTSNNTISIKKIVTANMSEETESDNPYQKALIAGIENKVKHNDKKKSPAQMKEWSILSDHVKYITSDGSETFSNLSIDQMNYRQDIDL